MDTIIKTQIIDLIHREVIPAIGCTEPIAVALAAAKAAEVLGRKPEKIEVYLSANILKNAMGVGIPGTGMVGLPIAIALGSIIGKSAYGLEVLKDLTPEGLKEGKEMVCKKCIGIDLKENVDKLYIEIISSAGNDRSRVIICHEHTHIIYVEKNGEVLTDLRMANASGEEVCENKDLRLSFSMVYEFAMEMPLDEIRFILETAELNKKAAQASMKGNYGHTVSKTVSGAFGRKFMGDSAYTHMLIMTSAACDARMDGAMIPVMSNSGSGNQGISATLPVLVYAEENGKSEEELIRALMLSHLMVIYIKQSLGRLSALCGCVVAATGASCAITYLMGGNKARISYAIKNMIGNITGMICDGAKPSCAMKVSSGVSTAMLSALMAMEDKVVTSVEGIIDEDVDYRWTKKRMVYLPNSKEVFNGSPAHINQVISDNLNMINDVLLFRLANYFLRFSNEYRAFHNLKSLGFNDWYEFVEYGTWEYFPINLQKNGFSREVASYINRYRGNYTVEIDGRTLLKRSLFRCANASVSREAKEVAYNMPEVFEEE